MEKGPGARYQKSKTTRSEARRINAIASRRTPLPKRAREAAYYAGTACTAGFLYPQDYKHHLAKIN